MWNRSEPESELLCPAAMVGYFDEMAAGDLDDATLAELAAKYSMEVTSAVPEGYL